MTGRHVTPYQATVRTPRERERLLEDLATLDVPNAVVAERGSTYLVFSPPARRRYGAGAATVMAITIIIAVLVAVASSVLWILLLPAAILPYVPLWVAEQPMIAVGAVDDDVEGVARLTVHGRAWGELSAALDAYLDHLPEAPPAPAADDVPAPEQTPVGAGAGGQQSG